MWGIDRWLYYWWVSYSVLSHSPLRVHKSRYFDTMWFHVPKRFVQAQPAEGINIQKIFLIFLDVFKISSKDNLDVRRLRRPK